MPLRIRVCALADLDPGTMASFRPQEIPGPLLLARLGDRVLAASGLCTHDDVELSKGQLKGPVVICPGHHYHYSLETGACLYHPVPPLPLYRAFVENGDVYVELASPQ